MQTTSRISLINKNKVQEWIGLLCIIGMLIGFICSRAILSISMIVLFANSLWGGELLYVWKRFKQYKFGWWAAIYFALIFIGGAWSEDQSSWWDIVMLNLPFLILPFGMMSVPFHTDEFKRKFLIAWNSILLGVMIVSLFTFFLDYDKFVEGYSHSKQIPTIKSGDHIRFSLLLSLSILPGLSYVFSNNSVNRDRLFNFFIGFSILFTIVYLHILSAKTGLLSLYLVLVLYGFQYLLKKSNRFLAILVPLIIISLILLLGYWISPTFQTKVDYLIYEIEMISSGQQLNYNYSSAGRIISYQVGWDQIKQYPFFGVGTGDVMHHMRSSYESIYPNIPKENQLIPHSQYLYNLLAYGIVFIPILIGIIVSPLFEKYLKDKKYLVITTIVFIISMLYESFLQVQLGIYVYLFFTTIWYRWND